MTERFERSLRRTALGLTFLALGCFSACSDSPRYLEIIEVVPAVDETLIGQDGAPARDDMLASYRNHEGLHSMCYYGDFDELVNNRNAQILEHLKLQDALEKVRTGCSMFQHGCGTASAIVGRNFDNVDSDLAAGWYFPLDGYRSLAFVQVKDAVFQEAGGFDPENREHLQYLLLGPSISVEGMNEKGVTVTLASLDKRPVRQISAREPRFLIHLVRDILDHAASVDEAVGIAEQFNVFDNGVELISHHIFLTDPDRSVVLEWFGGLMQVVPGEGSRQVVTNSDLMDVSEDDRRRECPRYMAVAKAVTAHEGPMTWRQGMDVLARAEQRDRIYHIDGRRLEIDTEWSTIFDPNNLEAYICLDGDFERVYHLKLFN